MRNFILIAWISGVFFRFDILFGKMITMKTGNKQQVYHDICEPNRFIPFAFGLY